MAAQVIGTHKLVAECGLERSDTARAQCAMRAYARECRKVKGVGGCSGGVVWRIDTKLCFGSTAFTRSAVSDGAVCPAVRRLRKDSENCGKATVLLRTKTNCRQTGNKMSGTRCKRAKRANTEREASRGREQLTKVGETPKMPHFEGESRRKSAFSVP